MNRTNSGVILWWIDPSSFSLQSTTIEPYELKRGASYESEAQWKMPDGVEHYEIIERARSGEEAAKDRLERLRVTAAELRATALTKRV